MNHRSRSVIGRVLIQVRRRIEHAKRRTLRTRQIRHVIRIAVEMSIDIVATSFVHTIIDPTARRGIGIERGQSYQNRRHLQRLGRSGGAQPRRERRRTVAGINPIRRIADIGRQAMAHPNFAALRVDQSSKHFAAAAAGENHLPTQTQPISGHGQPDEPKTALPFDHGAREMSRSLRPPGRSRSGHLPLRLLKRVVRILQRG